MELKLSMVVTNMYKMHSINLATMLETKQLNV